MHSFGCHICDTCPARTALAAQRQAACVPAIRSVLPIFRFSQIWRLASGAGDCAVEAAVRGEVAMTGPSSRRPETHAITKPKKLHPAR